MILIKLVKYADVWNVKQASVYFIIMFSINKKNIMHIISTMHNYKMHKTPSEDKQNRNTTQ